MDPRLAEELERLGFVHTDVHQIVEAMEIHVAEEFRAREIDPSARARRCRRQARTPRHEADG